MPKYCCRWRYPAHDVREVKIRGQIRPRSWQCVLLLFSLAGRTSADTEAIPTYAEIKAAVDAAYAKRTNLLRNAASVAAHVLGRPVVEKK